MKSALRRGESRETAGPGIVWLDDPKATTPDLAGAKAAALARATAAGLPVLPGVVLTTAFDRESDQNLAQLREAWCSISHGGEVSLVVRSSSTIEDSAATSMAGMFTSVLDVGGWEDFLSAIDTVLASRNVVPLADGLRHGGGQAPMAVLVQPYLAAASGGVLFGLDPISGREDRLVVAASERGPNALVSGEVDGTRYVLTRHGRLVEGPSEHGPLTGEQLRHLARIARQAEHLFSGPQDVEWAFDESGTFRLLQSRPVTAQGDAGSAVGPTFGPGPVAETFPDPLFPLEEDLWADPLRDGLREALALAATTSSRRLAASPILTSVGGRLAVDLDVMPGAKTSSSLLARLDPRPPLRRLNAAWRVGRLRAALPALGADLVARADEDLLSVDSAEHLSDGELLGLLSNARRGLASLHGHEVLMGWLVEADGSTVAAASVALRLLAEGRRDGLTDEEIVGRDPGVLALVPPAIQPTVELPPTPAALPPAPPTPAAGDPAILREALRLRARWLQELTARAAWELGRRLAERGVFGNPDTVRLLHLDELETAARNGTVPGDLNSRVPASVAPLPARFRLTVRGAVVAQQAPSGRSDGAHGAGGGRGAGIVHDGSGMPPQGAVLVVRTLDPSLAAVLPRLGGLVAETGSPLSHLAILAREMGVPTVVGVEGATTRFPAGALIMVDGTTGEVARFDKERGAA